jgi:hypothetical protein
LASEELECFVLSSGLEIFERIIIPFIITRSFGRSAPKTSSSCGGMAAFGRLNSTPQLLAPLMKVGNQIEEN